MEHKTVRERFDLAALDLNDPFELDDDNFPHLAKHAPFTADDLLEAWRFGDPLFYPATEDGPADWLMVARPPAAVVEVPLARPRHGDARTCRPIVIYQANRTLAQRYEEDSRR